MAKNGWFRVQMATNFSRQKAQPRFFAFTKYEQPSQTRRGRAAVLPWDLGRRGNVALPKNSNIFGWD